MAEQEVVVTPSANPGGEQDDVLFQKQEDGTWAVEYQPTDESGQPIGRPFRATGKTQKECFSNFQTAYNSIVREYHKLKTGQQQAPDLSKATRKRAAQEAKPRDWTAEEAFEITSQLQNPSTMRKAVRKAIEDELGLSLDELRNIPGSLTQVDNYFVGLKWQKEHPEFYNVPDNNNAMGRYLKQNNLAITAENLDIAFSYLKDSLIQRPQETTQQNQQQAQADSNQSQQRQRSASSGLLPGESSGQRPNPRQATSGKLTWAIVDSWSEAEWEKAKRDPVLIQQINALPPRSR